MPELVEMMEAVPLMTKKWGIFTDILVLPLSLDQYWEAFWADDAPYYVGAIERDPRDNFNNQTTWGDPSPGYEAIFGLPVL